VLVWLTFRDFQSRCSVIKYTYSSNISFPVFAEADDYFRVTTVQTLKCKRLWRFCTFHVIS